MTLPPHSGLVPAARPRRRGHSAPHGQFFTLETVARFVWRTVELLGPCQPPPWRVADLAAGDGVLLDSGCAGGWTTPARALGLEIDPRLVADRGIDPAEGAPIHLGDGLFDLPSNLRQPAPDIVVGNPPFGRCRELLSDLQRARLESPEGAAMVGIWGPRALTARGQLSARAGSCRVEQLFLARAIDCVRPGGLVAFIVSDGLLSNFREQHARDWLSERALPVAVVGLPSSAFRRPGLNAVAHLLLLRRYEPGGRASAPVRMVERRHAGRGRLPHVLDTILRDLAPREVEGTSAGTCLVEAAQLRGRRWDPGFWVGRRALTSWWPEAEGTADLGDFIEFLTYGPIVTGGQPRPAPDGVVSIRQGDFGVTGLRLEGALRVAANSPHDPRRSRVRRGDLLMPRSGGGALGQNRIAVFDDIVPANIGCFVDLIRLSPGLNPYFLWLFLRSTPGWGQIRSLINGVGTPNISFREIRSLRVPLIPLADQVDFERGYREDVLSLHREGGRSSAAQSAATAAFGGLVQRLEERLRADL